MSFNVFSAALIAAGLFIGAGASAAHHGAVPPARDPSNAAAPVPAVDYRRPFTTLADPGAAAVAPWRATNETVARIGGWRAYAREASAAAKPSDHGQHHPAAPAPAPRRAE